MTFQEFRASMNLIAPAAYDAHYGPIMADMAQPGDMVRCYEHGAWILYRADGTHWMHLENEEYSTGDGYSLADLEQTLWKWTTVEDRSQKEEPNPAEPLPTPAEDADHEELLEWALESSPTHRAKLAAALLLQMLDPENGKPDFDAADIIAASIGPDYTMSLAQLAAEIHRRA